MSEKIRKIITEQDAIARRVDVSLWNEYQRDDFIRTWQALVQTHGSPLPDTVSNPNMREAAWQLGLIRRPSATVECTWDGRKYRGTVYLVEGSECE